MLILLQRIASAPAGDDIAVLADLIALIRPRKPTLGAQAADNVRVLIALLMADPALAAGLRHYVLHVLSSRRHTTLYTDTGILPNDGFFTELFRRLSYRVLPPAIDNLYLSDCLDRILSDETDYVWMRAVPADDWLALLDVIANNGVLVTPDAATLVDVADRRKAHLEILEAIQTLSHRISAMGLEPALVRVHPDLENFASPFLVQNVEVHRYLDDALSQLKDDHAPSDDAAHLLVMLDQCDTVLARIRKNTRRLGTSVALTYLMVRLAQNIERLRRLLSLLDLTPVPAPWTDSRRRRALAFALDLAEAHNRKYKLRELFAANIDLLARNVTENASQTGEHYIAETRKEYLAMLRSSAGAGVIIGFMALIKILTAALRSAPLVEAFLFSLNYSLGFMLIHLLHFTVATKQPAMTAARIAADLHTPDSRMVDVESLAGLIVKVLRTQFVAVLGNLATVFPTALGIGWVTRYVTGHHLVAHEKALHMLHDINPFTSMAIVYAAIAGVCLFLAGLISGYFDNRAMYTHMAQRVLRLRGLQRLIGPARHLRIANYLEHNLGGLMGNFFFGILLAFMSTFGDLLGLPIDVRHVTLSSANLAIAVFALDFKVTWQVLAVSGAGILCIGSANLLVSFSLALMVAMRSRQVRFRKGWMLVKALLSHLWHRPQDFFIAPKTQASSQ
jgi:site-specific recombinase